MLSSPEKRGRKDCWETVSGALEAGETILEGSLRETSEEIGLDVKVRPLGTVHTYTFHYDNNVQYMISVCYLMEYEGGQIQPGDDMIGSQYRWLSLGEIQAEIEKISVPGKRIWLFKRALGLYRLWKHQSIDLMQLGLNPMD